MGRFWGDNAVQLPFYGYFTTLRGFIDWAMKEFPADHYALIISDHGGGWKGVSWDYKPGGDFLKMSELSTALNGVHLDLIGFDACLMAMLEVAHQVQPYADVMVASEEVEPSFGWPYDDILEWLADNPDTTSKLLGAFIVRAYDDYYSDVQPYDHRTLSAIDLGRVPDLSNLVSQFSVKLANGVEDYKEHDDPNDNVQIKIKRDRGLSEEFEDKNFIDLKDFANWIRLDPYIPAKYKSPEDSQIVALLETDFDDGVIIAEKHGPVYPWGAHGLSIYFPKEQEYCNRVKVNNRWECRDSEPFDISDPHLYAHDNDNSHGYVPPNHPAPEDTDFTFPQDTQWDEFLHRYYKPVADACIRTDDGCASSVTVPVSTTVTLSGVGSSDSEGRERNNTPEYPGGMEYWFWDFDPDQDTDFLDHDRDFRNEDDDDLDKQGRLVDFHCPEPGFFPIRLMTWDEHYDYQRIWGWGNPLAVRRLPHWKVDDDWVTVECTVLWKPPTTTPDPVTVPLGEPVDYVVELANDSSEEISFQATDTLPTSMFLRVDSLSCPGGDCSFDPDINRIDWSVTLAPEASGELGYIVEITETVPLTYPYKLINWITITDSFGYMQETSSTITVTNPTCLLLTGVTIEGGDTITVGESLTLTSSYEPLDASEPITYEWSTDGILWDPDLDSATYRWLETGGRTVALTVTNCEGEAMVTDTHEVTVTPPPCEPLTGVTIEGGDTVTVGEDLELSARCEPEAACGDETIDYEWSMHNLIDGQGTPTATYRYDEVSEYTVVLTVTNCSGEVVVVYTHNVIVSSPIYELSVVKSDAPDPTYPGSSLTYTITVTNTGQITATEMVVTETYPGDVFIEGANPGASAGNNVWYFDGLSPGDVTNITIWLMVEEGVSPGTVLTNTVEVDSAQTDPVTTTEETEVEGFGVAPVKRSLGLIPPSRAIPHAIVEDSLRASTALPSKVLRRLR